MWNKINEKLYRITLNDELTDIKTPYGVCEALFMSFISTGGVITDEGKVETDPGTLIMNFKKTADILLTKYDQKGVLLEEGNCFNLSSTEISELFAIATSVIEGFILTVQGMGKKSEPLTVQESSDAEKAPKAKAKTPKE